MSICIEVNGIGEIMAKDIDYKELNSDELRNRMASFKDELFHARLKFRVGQFRRTSEFSRLRKEVARIKSHLRLREIGQEQEKAK